MPFLAITAFLMYANLIAAFRQVGKPGRGPLIGGAHMLTCVAASIAFLGGLELLQFGLFGSIGGDAYNWTPLAYFVFGAMSLVLFGIKFVSAARAGQWSGNLRFGLSLWAVVAAVYVCGTAVDHWVFFRDGNKSGSMDVGFTGEQMTCSGDQILVRLTADTAVFRCPKSIRLGRDYAQPFVPWPSYVQGESTKLRANVDAVQKAAADAKGGVIHLPASVARYLSQPPAESN